MNQKGVLSYTFEYDGRGKDPGCVELQIHFGFTPGTPERGNYGPVENYDPGSGFEVWMEHAEMEVHCDGKTAWQSLIPGEWLEGQCENYLATREESDLTDCLPDNEPDYDRMRDERRDRELTERHRPREEGDGT